MKKTKTNLLKHELNLWNSGLNLVAGVDEAGRGPLAGPLVAAAVILDRDSLINDVALKEYGQIRDSKVVSPKKRELLFDFIIQNAVSYSIVEVSVEDIDKGGIASANRTAFYNSILGLGVEPEHILTDFFKLPEFEPARQTNLKRGDSLSVSIAAASILAKVHRDGIMLKMHERWPHYGFDRHKGYGTAFHREMIAKHGPCEAHRNSFKLLV